MRILITGSRHWHAYDLAEQILNRLLLKHGPGFVIVHGGAAGVDRAFAEACDDLGIDHEPHPANWKEHGKGAGPLRNAEMVALGASLCIAVHEDIRGSRGTRDCARKAIAAGIPTYLVDSEEAIPQRLRADDPRLS